MIIRQLIDIEYIINNTPVLSYLTQNELFPYVKKAQEIYLEQKIGDYLYNLYQITDFNDLTPIHQNFLVYYIKPVLSAWTIYLYGKTTNFKFTNRGLSKQSSDYSQPIDLQEVIYLNDNYRDDAEGYTRRMVDYMGENSEALGIKKCEITTNIYNPYIPLWYATRQVRLR